MRHFLKKEIIFYGQEMVKTDRSVQERGQVDTDTVREQLKRLY